MPYKGMPPHFHAMLPGKIQIFPYAFKTYGGTAVILRRIPSVFPFIQKKLRFHLILTGHGIILRAQLPTSYSALKYLRRNGGPHPEIWLIYCFQTHVIPLPPLLRKITNYRNRSDKPEPLLCP